MQLLRSEPVQYVKGAFLLLLMLCLFFITCSNSSERESKLTKKQKDFAKVINETTTIVNAKWLDPLTLEITIDFSPSKSSKKLANDIANTYSNTGYTVTKKDICVKVIDPNMKELAYRCVVAEKL